MEEEKLSMEELKSKAISLDKAEVWDLYGKKDENKYPCNRHMLVYNATQKTMACIARRNYTVIQHEKAIETVTGAIAALNIKAEAELKTSKHGIQVDIDFPEVGFELEQIGERFISGLRLENDYSWQAGLVISPRVTRLACSNGMIITEIIGAKRIKWTEQLNVELKGIIDKLIKDIVKENEKLAGIINECIEDTVEHTTANLLARFMFRKKKHVNEIISKLPRDNDKVSRWDFYNAVTNYATHNKRLKPDTNAWLHNKANEIMKNSFEKLCQAELPKPKDATPE